MMDYETIIESYNELRERCLIIAKLNDELMGSDAWLKFAIDDSDIKMYYSEQGIVCFGSCFTTQTMSNEHFNFTIPYSYIEEFNARTGD